MSSRGEEEAEVLRIVLGGNSRDQGKYIWIGTQFDKVAQIWVRVRWRFIICKLIISQLPSTILKAFTVYLRSRDPFCEVRERPAFLSGADYMSNRAGLSPQTVWITSVLPAH